MTAMAALCWALGFTLSLRDASSPAVSLLYGTAIVLGGWAPARAGVQALRVGRLDMNVLTVISSIFIPLTFIVGIYGMNFAQEANGKKMPWNMPELYQPWGYVAVMLFMLGIAVFQILYFKRRRWL